MMNIKKHFFTFLLATTIFGVTNSILPAIATPQSFTTMWTAPDAEILVKWSGEDAASDYLPWKSRECVSLEISMADSNGSLGSDLDRFARLVSIAPIVPKVERLFSEVERLLPKVETSDQWWQGWRKEWWKPGTKSTGQKIHYPYKVIDFIHSIYDYIDYIAQIYTFYVDKCQGEHQHPANSRDEEFLHRQCARSREELRQWVEWVSKSPAGRRKTARGGGISSSLSEPRL